MTSTAQTTLPVTLTPPPNPLPPTWARAIANSIAEQLRHGWRHHKVKSTIHPTGAPRSPTYNGAATFPTQLPSSYLEYEEAYAQGLVEPIDELGVPWIAWHITQLDLAEALNKAGLITHANDVNTWLKQRYEAGQHDEDEHPNVRLPKPFVRQTNRHGRPTLRRNTRFATPQPVADALQAAAHAATIWLPDPRDVDDHLAEGDAINLRNLIDSLHESGLTVKGA